MRGQVQVPRSKRLPSPAVANLWRSKEHMTARQSHSDMSTEQEVHLGDGGGGGGGFMALTHQVTGDRFTTEAAGLGC